MIYIFCGEIKSFTQEEKEAIRRLFSAESSKLYTDGICRQKNLRQADRSLSCLWGLSRLSYYLGADVCSLPLKKTPDGKPYFENSGLKFSFSHSNRYFAVALSNSGDVGIDIEEDRLTPEKAVRLAERFFSEKEREYIRVSASPTRDFLTVWTFKEAYTKMIGKPLSDTARFDTEPLAKHRHTFTYRDATVTVCAETESEEVRIFS